MKKLFILIATAIAIDGFAEGKRTISYDGNEVREVNVTAFNAIETSSAVNILYTPREGEPQVEIHAPADAMPHIDVHVTADNVLTATFVPSVKEEKQEWRKKVAIHVAAPPVTALKATSAGDIILQGDLSTGRPVHLTTHSSGNIVARTIRCKELHIESFSSGEVIVRTASCEEDASCQARSAGNIILKGLECNSLQAQSHSSGDIHIDHLSCQDVETQTQSSGDILLSGTCQQASFNASSNGRIYAGKLQATAVKASASSSGRIECQAIHSLEAGTSSHGEITYKGNPAKINTNGKNISPDSWMEGY